MLNKNYEKPHFENTVLSPFDCLFEGEVFNFIANLMYLSIKIKCNLKSASMKQTWNNITKNWIV